MAAFKPFPTSNKYYRKNKYSVFEAVQSIISDLNAQAGLNEEMQSSLSSLSSEISSIEDAVNEITVINTPVIVSGTTYDMPNGYGRFIFTGASASTWTCFSINDNADKLFSIHNRGTAAITLNSNEGDDDFFDNTENVSTKTINPGDNFNFYCDGSYFIIH